MGASPFCLTTHEQNGGNTAPPEGEIWESKTSRSSYDHTLCVSEKEP
jgi:hypothetical protein